ncbi:MAG: hypothetical protein H5T66_13255, partial [Chloroflexi bacterium]|nr:hypothetical protein [Chloroflexota bacterium]
MRRDRKALLHLLALALFMAVSPVGGALAQGNARVTISPASATVGEGQTTAVQVWVRDVQDLYGLDIRLQFDPAAVEVVDEYPQQGGIQVRPGDFLNVDFIIRNTVNNEEGTIWYALTQVNPSAPASGSGVAFVILFRGKRAGLTSTLAFTNAQLATRSGAMIPCTAEDGEIRVVQAEQAPPTPTQAPPPPEPTILMPTPTNTPIGAPTATPTRTPTFASTPASTATPTLASTVAATATRASTPQPTPTGASAAQATALPTPLPAATQAGPTAASPTPALAGSPTPAGAP